MSCTDSQITLNAPEIIYACLFAGNILSRSIPWMITYSILDSNEQLIRRLLKCWKALRGAVVKKFLCEHEKPWCASVDVWKVNQAFHKAGAKWNKPLHFWNTGRHALRWFVCVCCHLIAGFTALIRKRTSAAMRRFYFCERAAVSAANTLSGLSRAVSNAHTGIQKTRTSVLIWDKWCVSQ